MYHIIFTIIFTLIFSQSTQAATEQINTIAAQPYTAQNHFQDIQMLLEPLKYKDNEIGLFSFEKRKTNQTLDSINYAFEKTLKEKGNDEFLFIAIPLLSMSIHKKDHLKIPPSKALCFYETFIALNTKRDEELKRLGKENLVQNKGWR